MKTWRTLQMCLLFGANLVTPARADNPLLEIARLMDQPPPVPYLVDAAIGGATQPTADPKLFVAALESLDKEAMRFDALRQQIEQRKRMVLDSAGVAMPEGVLVGGFLAADLVRPALVAASIRLHGEGRLGEPLNGETPPGPGLARLGMLLGARGTDELVQRRYAAAIEWFRGQARFAALVAADARTLQEVALSISNAQEALALLELTERLRHEGSPETLDQDLLERIRSARGILGSHSRKLGQLRMALMDPAHTNFWAAIALRHPSKVWRYEALNALTRTARSKKDKPAGDKALAGLLSLAKAGVEASPYAVRALRQLGYTLAVPTP